MRFTRPILIATATLAFAFSAYAQDSPLLGDVARQVRQQKQKDAKSKDGTGPAKSPTVITNETLPSHESSPVQRTEQAQADDGNDPENQDRGKMSAEQWRGQIQQQKQQISGLQSKMEKLNDSIRFAPGSCVRNCEQWNERQTEKQQQVDVMKSQLEDAKKHLEQMQDAAKRQGYGSSVYDP